MTIRCSASQVAILRFRSRYDKAYQLTFCLRYRQVTDDLPQERPLIGLIPLP